MTATMTLTKPASRKKVADQLLATQGLSWHRTFWYGAEELEYRDQFNRPVAVGRGQFMYFNHELPLSAAAEAAVISHHKLWR